MGQARQAVIEPVGWSAPVADMLAGAVNFASVEDFRRQVENGAALFGVVRGDDLLGVYLLRVDHLASGPEGVIVAAVGHADFGLIESVLPYVERQFLGCHSVRVHTARPGLVRKLAAVGYAPQEFVLRKVLQ